MPTVASCKHGPGCPEHTIRADYPETAELAELREIKATQGIEAAGLRHKQQQRNRQRRQVAVGRKRFAAIALEKNIRLAAEKLAERKLAEQKAAADPSSTKRPPASADTTSVQGEQPQEEALSIA